MTQDAGKHAPTTREILRLFAHSGDSAYGHEAVSQLEHALQAALLAEQADAAPHQIVAALLHDLGHLLHGLPDDAPDHGIDDLHEDLAARWMRSRFDARIVEPVRLHVAAKRYLCAVDSTYESQLSVPSKTSLALQGGPMSAEEVREFSQSPFCEAAVALRRWDDAAKVGALPTPGLDHFAQYLDLVAQEPSE